MALRGRPFTRRPGRAVLQALSLMAPECALLSDEEFQALLTERMPDLAQKLARLAELEGEFAAALEREKLAALKELAYGASHEINNPLANISTRAQALLRDETDPERRRKLAT